MNIAIIGYGWYGGYIALLLQEKYNVTIFEKRSKGFDNSSFYNQNRLHQGFHYPRSHKTRSLCKKGFSQFKDKFEFLCDPVHKNYYLVDNKSCLDFQTFYSIYKFENYDFEILENDFIQNCENKIIKTGEMVINSQKVMDYFLSTLNCDIVYNYEINNIRHGNNKIILNNEYEFDYVFDCTNNQLNLIKQNVIFEKTISFVYKKVNEISFDAITIMDGPFMSLYPRFINEDIYTLTDVVNTPFCKSHNLDTILKKEINENEINSLRDIFEKKIIKYYPEFKKNFTYVDYYFAYKCKLENNNDSRELVIENNNNVISILCGKITGIFEVEHYIKSLDF